MKNHKDGFTLIELLVVIAIVSLLSGVVLASLNGARAKARDAQRTTSIKQVQNALGMYFTDNGKYPSSPDVVLASALTSLLTPFYISKIPADPNSSTPFRYYNGAANPATWYAIKINYETKPACYACGGDFQTPFVCASFGFWGVSACSN